MTSDALEQAKRSLRICDVYLRNASMAVSEAFDHRSGLSESISAQFRHVVEKSEVLISDNGEDAKRFSASTLISDIAGEKKRRSLMVPDGGKSEADHFSELGRIEGSTSPSTRSRKRCPSNVSMRSH